MIDSKVAVSCSSFNDTPDAPIAVLNFATATTFSLVIDELKCEDSPIKYSK